jgi:hypothetical protein
MDKEFKFKLNAQVSITVSGETGTVLGRAEYTSAEDNYYVRYKGADGQAKQDWWPESALQDA